MSFVNKIKGPDEKLLGVAYIHWIYGLQGILWLAGFMALGTFVGNFLSHFFVHYQDNPGYRVVSGFSGMIFWVCTLLGLILFFFYVLMIATTEIGLTDKRVIYKRGFLFVKVIEVDIEEVKGVNVDNGILGRILNYGYIFLDSRFVENINLPALADPYRFVKALNEMRSKIKEDSMNIVLSGPNGSTAVNSLNALQKESGDQQAQPQAQPQKKQEAQQPEETPAGRKKAKPKKLDNKRYKGLTDNPLDAVQQIVDETQEDAQQTVQTLNKNTGKPVKVPRKMFSKAPKEEGAEKPLYTKVSDKLRPIIFRQEKMREDIKESFSDNTSIH